MMDCLSTNFRRLYLLLGLTLIGFFWGPKSSLSQQFILQGQQPVIRTFGINTSIRVPDGGTLHLGGVSRSSGGRVTAGTPLVGNLPYAGPLLGNRTIGQYSSAGQASVRVHIISSKELEEQVLKEASRRLSKSLDEQLNGNHDIQRKADFIQRNIGRR